MSDLRKRDVPGVPVVELYGMIALAGLVALVHLPPVFRRLPRKAKWGAFAAIFAMMVPFGIYLGHMAVAYERTPEGAKEAAERAKLHADLAKADAEQAARDAETRKLADAEAAVEKGKEIQAGLKSCFSWGHDISTFTQEVKDSLHNPASFEHVKTELMEPDYEGKNVQMTFRAENGFGAIRTGHVSAHLAEDCSVSDIGKFESD